MRSPWIALFTTLQLAAGCHAAPHDVTAIPTPAPAPTEAKAGSSKRNALNQTCDEQPEPESVQPPEPESVQPPEPYLMAEMVNLGSYFVENRFPFPVRISGRDHGGVVTIQDVIEPREIAHVYDVYEGSGGHVRPTNFFASISVEPATGGPALYQGVRNDDWKDQGVRCERSRYLLVVGP